ERPERPLHDRAQPAEPAHVDLVVHAVHHGAGTKEHVRLEEAVGEQMQDADGVDARTETDGEHHVTDLAHRRGGQHLLDVVVLAVCASAAPKMPANENVPKVANMSMIAKERPRSPTRLTRKAFFAATAALGL